MDMIRMDVPSGLSMPLGEAMFTQRATRRLDPNRAIPEEAIKLLLDAASKAPNGGNAQPARYLVVNDREKIREFGPLYHEAWWAKRRDGYGWKDKHDIPAGSPYRMPALLADEMGNAPMVVLAFSTGGPGEAMSVLPGVQNMLLAARALGIGSVLTTLHAEVLDRVFTLFDVPADMTFHYCIPFGYPRGNFGPTSRYASADTSHWNTWDNPVPWK